MHRELPKKWLGITLLSLMLTGCGGGGDSGSQNLLPGTPSSGTTPQTIAGGLPADYELVWSDEFNTDGMPDTSKWSFDTERNSVGWYNNELQYYSADRPENAQVINGSLVITARKESLTSAADYGNQNYTSARLITRNKASWTYGFFEIRAKLPCGTGTWPAIWMLSTSGTWPDGGEIDIMEYVGRTPETIFGTLHTRSTYNTVGGKGDGKNIAVSNVCTDFHNYQMTWTPEAIQIGVDDKIYHTYPNKHTGTDNWPFDNPQYLLMNIAVGGTFGGSTVDDTIFPVTMEVDYVRVYQKKPT